LSAAKTQNHWDLIIVGGGLSGGLLAWRLSERHPSLRVLLVERADRLGGNHTWSFHEHDVQAPILEWLAPLVSGSWQGYDVHFPAYERVFSSEYFSIRSDSFHQFVASKLGARVWFQISVRSLSETEVELETGERLHAGAVIDARGLKREELLEDRVGYQKFVGLDLQLAEPHGLRRPLLMDTRLDQSDGYRFMYLIPWGERTLLAEDTYYNESPKLDVPVVREEIARYLRGRGWTIELVHREEVGCLAIPMYARFLKPELQREPGLRIGMRGGFFHPVTGYSLPEAARFAWFLAELKEFSPSSIRKALDQYARETEASRSYGRLLNRMLFRASEAAARVGIFQKFYRHSEGLIRRFYAGRLTWMDRVKILSGKPPVAIRRAIPCFVDREKFWEGNT
jgi:lycopene beta-cyclase